MTEQVIIEFVSTTEGLQPAEDKLAAMGKIDKATADTFKKSNQELKNRVTQINALGATTQKLNTETGKIKGTITDLDKATKSFSKNFAAGFQEGVIETLKDAGVSAKDFEAAMKKSSTESGNSADSLKAKLRQMQEQLVKMQLAGQGGSPAFKKLEEEAGHLKDTIADVAQGIKNVGSDTASLDGLVGIASGISGAFSAAQGAVALFGTESEELQEVLLRVNAAMAVTQGLTQLQTVLQKESAAAKLADIIVTRAQTAAQTAFNFVVGTSTGVLKAFRIALAATGVGLLVIGLIELVSALQSTDDGLEEVNEELERNKQLIEGDVAAIKVFTERQIAMAKLAGKAESELIKIRGKGLVDERNALEKRTKELERQRDGVDKTSSAYFALNKRIEENNEAIRNLNNEAVITSIDLQVQLQEEQKKASQEAKEAAEKAAADAKKRAAELRQIRLDALNDELAGLELQALKAEKGGQIEIDIQKKILAAKAKIELEAEGITANQKLLVQEKSLQDQINLQKEFNAKSSQVAIEGLISRNNAELQQLNLNNSERLRLTIENIISQAQIEADAAQGNSAKIKEINAKRDADIKAARLKSIQETLEYEIKLQEATYGADNRALKAIIANEKTSLRVRFEAIDALTDYELRQTALRVDALNESRSKGLIGQKEYNLQYEVLIDEQRNIVETAEEAKRNAAKKTLEEQKALLESSVQNVLQVYSMAVSTLDQLYQLQTAKETQHIDEQRKKIQELREAGAITEKEEQRRLRMLEAQEKVFKTRQAQREKQIAVFQALLAVPASFLRGLKDGGLPLAIIYGALAAVQAALVAARPIPKFKKGKKDSYEGLGEVGEAGTELIEKNGRMYVAEKSTIIWLGKNDKVYNPAETKKMLAKPQPHVNKSLMTVVNNSVQKEIDYDKLAGKIGDQIAKKTPHTVLNITEKGMSELVKQGNSTTEYLEKRRRF